MGEFPTIEILKERANGMSYKICTKCNSEKQLSRFRFRSKNGYKWQQGFCMDCEAKKERERRNANIELYRKKVKDYLKSLPIEKRKERNKKQWLKKKGNKDWNEYRKRYWEQNEEQRLKHKSVAKKSQIRKIEELWDSYIIGQITQRTSIKKEDVPKELIELVRQIKITNRLIKNNDREKTNINS